MRAFYHYTGYYVRELLVRYHSELNKRSLSSVPSAPPPSSRSLAPSASSILVAAAVTVARAPTRIYYLLRRAASFEAG